jgi:hypothetical protein
MSSSASTVPLDLIHDQDNDFVDEIDEVDPNSVEEIDVFSSKFILVTTLNLGMP